MSKTKGTPVKTSGLKSTDSDSSKNPVLGKKKAKHQSENVDQDYFDKDPSKTKADHDEEDVEYYQNSE